jgi:hypothetical protein
LQFEQFLSMIVSKMEIPSSYIRKIYEYLSNRLTQTESADQLLLEKLLKVLKIIYLFLENKSCTPNYSFVFGQQSSQLVHSSQAKTQDLTESVFISFWINLNEAQPLANPEAKPPTNETCILSLLNNEKQGYTLQYDRSSSYLTYVVREGEAVNQAVSLTRLERGHWSYVRFKQSVSISMRI